MVGDGSSSAATILSHEDSETNGIVYVDVVMDMSHVAAEISLMSMFVRSLTEAGTDTLDEAGLTQNRYADRGHRLALFTSAAEIQQIRTCSQRKTTRALSLWRQGNR